jgi:hypothetical protein
LYKRSTFCVKLQKQGSAAAAAAASSSSTTCSTAETLKQQPYMFTWKAPSKYLSFLGGIVPKAVGSNTLSTTSDALTNY